MSEVRQLAPHGLSEIKDLNTYEAATGTTGDLEVLIEAPDLTDPATVEWMAAFKRRVLAADEVTAGPALSDFLTKGEGKVTKSGIEATLEALSSYSLRQVAPLDPKTGKIGHLALISFGISSQTLAEQQALLRSVRDQIGNPPPGVEVSLTGLPVIATEAASELSSSRYWLALAGLGAVALVLLLLRRSFRRALVPLLPTVLATGWASLLIWITGIPLNPMSAALGALTIAIATEFAVILSGRFEQERLGRPRRRRRAPPRLRADRRRRARLRPHRDRRLRRPDRLRHPHAAGLRRGHRDRSRGGAPRRRRDPPGDAGDRRARSSAAASGARR